MTRFSLILLALAMLAPSAAQANGRADITLIPTRVVIQKAERFFTIVVKNTGDTRGDYSAELIDMKMSEAGDLVPYAEGETPTFSAIPYLRIAPKSFSLAPGEIQSLRVIANETPITAAGEYRAHLKLSLKNDGEKVASEEGDGKSAAVTIKASIVTTIPVLLRHGAMDLKMAMENSNLTLTPDGKATVNLDLARTGNRSVMGNIDIACVQKNNTLVPIKTYAGIAVYRQIDRRHVSIPLDEMPKGFALSQCKQLNLSFTAQPQEGGTKMAEALITLK